MYGSGGVAPKNNTPLWWMGDQPNRALLVRMSRTEKLIQPFTQLRLVLKELPSLHVHFTASVGVVE